MCCRKLVPRLVAWLCRSSTVSCRHWSGSLHSPARYLHEHSILSMPPSKEHTLAGCPGLQVLVLSALHPTPPFSCSPTIRPKTLHSHQLRCQPCVHWETTVMPVPRGPPEASSLSFPTLLFASSARQRALSCHQLE